VHLLRGDSP